MIPRFLGPLVTRAKEPDTWILERSFSYQTLTLGKPRVITAPAGFENDLASIPRLLTFAFKVNGKHRWSAVIHDWLYANKGEIGTLRLTRKECDLIFLEAMKVKKVGYIKRSMMFRGVRVGGFVAWSKK